MTRLNWTILAILSAVCGLWVGREKQSIWANPGLEVSDRLFDVSAVAGSALLVEIPVSNTAANPDRVLGVRSSCSCMTVAELPRVVSPGETWSLPVTIDLGDGNAGELFEYEIVIFLESGSAVPVQIRVRVAPGDN